MIKVQYFNLEEKSYHDHPSKTIQLVHVRNRRQFSSASAFSFAARTNLVNNTKVEGTRTRLCLGRLRNCLSRRAGEKRIAKKKKKARDARSARSVDFVSLEHCCLESSVNSGCEMVMGFSP